MALFHGKPRFDPYRNFKFRVKIDGAYVAGVSKVGALKRTSEVARKPLAGKPPRAAAFEPITLERGVTHDQDFVAWAVRTSVPGRGGVMQDVIGNFERDLVIEELNEKGAVVTRYFIRKCWVSEFQALPDLDANANAVAIEKLKLEHEGWERDTTVTKPAESNFLGAAAKLLAMERAALAFDPGRAQREYPAQTGATIIAEPTSNRPSP